MKVFNKHYLISGRVQGVGFRAFTCKIASELGIKGWVRNLADGRVEVLASVHSEDALFEFTQRLQAGPASAAVDKIEELDVDENVRLGLKFEIKPDGRHQWQS